MEDGRTLQLVSFRMESREIEDLDRQARNAGLSRSELIRMRLAMPIEVDSECRWYVKQAADGRSKRFARDPGETESASEKTSEETDSRSEIVRNRTVSDPKDVRFRTFSSPEEERRWRMEMFEETGNGSYLYRKILTDGSVYDPAKPSEQVGDGTSQGSRERHEGSGTAPEKARAQTFSEPKADAEGIVKVLLTDAAWRDLKVELTRWGTNFNQGVRAINTVARRLNANQALRRNDVDEIVAALRTVARTLDGCRKGLGKVGEMVDGIAADYGARRSDRGR